MELNSDGCKEMRAPDDIMRDTQVLYLYENMRDEVANFTDDVYRHT